MLHSDNNAGVHAKVMESIVAANQGSAISYGGDDYSAKARQQIRELLGADAEVFFILNGTAANVLGLSSTVRPYEACVCSEIAHLNVDECAAYERFVGSKLLPAKAKDGKISVESVKAFFTSFGDQHQAQPKVISITQPTEVGTTYTIEEIRALADLAHANNMYLHVDGSRISNAVVSLQTSFKEMLTDSNVDIMSFGGTKNGMMYGEAIVVFNKELAKNMTFILKQGMQLTSKLRFVAAQFSTLLSEDLWKINASNANSMATLLKNELAQIPGVEIVYEVQANMVFFRVAPALAKQIAEIHDLELSDGCVLRCVTSFSTQEEEIMNFVHAVRALVEGN